MKTILKTLLICAAALASTISSFGQGSLTPPGAPAPTMKTLDQVKAGTPITSAPYNITASGNYFLTGNLTQSGNSDGIDVNASGVTIDLNGFTISGSISSGGATGISISSTCQDITVLNGHIIGGVIYSGSSGNYTGLGFANGVSYGGTGNVRVTGVTVSGVSSSGIILGGGNSTVVDSCLVNTAGAYGIVAEAVSHSTANLCGNTGISTFTASDCNGGSTGSGDGLDAGNASNCYGFTSGNGTGLYAYENAENCYGTSNGGDGLDAGENTENCYGYANGSGYGVYAGSSALSCTGSSNANYGFYATIADSCAGVGVPNPYIVGYKYNMP